MSGFFDIDEDGPKQVGSGLLDRKIKTRHSAKQHKVNTEDLEEVGNRTGFSRLAGGGEEVYPARLRGRPPLNEEMTYWRVYIKPSVRDALCKIRDERGIRLNDVIEKLLQESDLE